MATTKKQQTLLLTPEQIQALKNSASGSTSVTGTKAVDSALVNNNQLGFKDSNGKLLPNAITVAQLESTLKDTKNKYNTAAIETLKQKAIVTMPPGSSLSATGEITPTEIVAIRDVAAKGYMYTPGGTPIDLIGTAAAIKNGTLNNSVYPDTSFSRTNIDQPNIEASKSTINDIFLGLLGRTATEKEINQYTQKYLNYAAKNPVSTESGATTYRNVTTQSASGAPSNRVMKGSQSYTSTSNNLTEQEFMKNQVRQSGEYNAFTAAGSAFDMLTNMAKKDTGAM
jgi:hypothetical protein